MVRPAVLARASICAANAVVLMSGCFLCAVSVWFILAEWVLPGTKAKENAKARRTRRFATVDEALPLLYGGWYRRDGRWLQRSIEEVGGGLVGGEPVLVEQEAVDFVGEDEFFDVDVAGAEGVGEHGGLGVGDLGVVVAVDEEDRRLPLGDVRHWRTCVGQCGDFFLSFECGAGAVEPIRPCVIFAGPLVDAVEVDAGSEEVGVAGEGERGEVAAVASSPDADVGGVDVGARAEVGDGDEDVVVFGCAVRSAMLALAEVEAVADASAIVDTEDDVAARRQVLVHGVGVGVVVHGRVAEEHLALGASVEEEDGGVFGAGGRGEFGEEKLAVELEEVVGGREDNLGGGDQLGGGVVHGKFVGVKRGDDRWVSS